LFTNICQNGRAKRGGSGTRGNRFNNGEQKYVYRHVHDCSNKKTQKTEKMALFLEGDGP